MKYYETIQNVVDFIEDNLNDRLNSNDLAQIAGFSNSHFIVMFQKYTGYSVMTYIRNRRLDKSLEFIKCSNHTITEISYLLGFESHDVFGRAFKRKYGITPYQYRNGNYLLPIFNQVHLIYEEMEMKMENVNVLTTPEMHLIGIEQRIVDDDTAKDRLWKSYFDNWEEFFGSIDNRVNKEEEIDYALCLNEDEEGYTYFIGIEVESLSKIPNGTVARTIPKLRCAKFTAKGPISSAVKETYEYVFKKWFTCVDFQILSKDITSIEVYDKRSDPNQNTGDLEMDICIPIEPAVPKSKEVLDFLSFKAVYFRESGEKKDWSKIKKKAFKKMVDWTKKNNLYQDKDLSVFSMNGVESDVFWYEVFIPVNDLDLKEGEDIQVKNYDGGLCIRQSTVHKMLEPTAKTMEKWCEESEKYQQVYRKWYEEFIIDSGKVTIDTIIRLHMWIKEKNDTRSIE